MAVTVTLNVNPTTQRYGLPIAFSGTVLEDGVPVDDVNVSIRKVEGDAYITAVATDFMGNYRVEWTPSVEWVGSFQVRARADIYQGFFSPPITITVTDGLPRAGLPWMAFLQIIFGSVLVSIKGK